MSRIILNIPMPPTPNSGMHLGHLAGPYLTADIANRALKRIGRESYLLSGLDSFEDWVSSKTTDDLSEYLKETREHLSIFGIQFDHFVLPNHLPGPYQETHKDIFHQIVTQSFSAAVTEKIYSNGNAWGFNSNIKGKCKQCGYAMAGYACPRCYQVSEPWELEQAIPQFDQATLQDVVNDFLILPSNSLPLEKLSAKQRLLVAKNLSGSDFRVRLTYQSKYGVACEEGSPKVIRNHFYMYCAFLKKLFFEDTDAEIIAFMGFDNLIPSGLSALCIDQMLDGTLNIKRIFTNEMLFYNNQKFSKTLGNGPTLSAVKEMCLSTAKMSSLRVYLASLNLENITVNFSFDDYEAFHLVYNAAVSDIRVQNASAIQTASAEVARLLLDFAEQRMTRADLTRHYMDSLISHNDTSSLHLMPVLDPIGHLAVTSSGNV